MVETLDSEQKTTFEGAGAMGRLSEDAAREVADETKPAIDKAYDAQQDFEAAKSDLAETSMADAGRTDKVLETHNADVAAEQSQVDRDDAIRVAAEPYENSDQTGQPEQAEAQKPTWTVEVEKGRLNSKIFVVDAQGNRHQKYSAIWRQKSVDALVAGLEEEIANGTFELGKSLGDKE
jgi:hypothetical protein